MMKPLIPNPAGPLFKNHTDAFIQAQSRYGRVDRTEASILGNQNEGILGRVGWDKDHGLDPTTDPVLAGMQIHNRRSAQLFASFNPPNPHVRKPAAL